MLGKRSGKASPPKCRRVTFGSCPTGVCPSAWLLPRFVGKKAKELPASRTEGLSSDHQPGGIGHRKHPAPPGRKGDERNVCLSPIAVDQSLTNSAMEGGTKKSCTTWDARYGYVNRETPNQWMFIYSISLLPRGRTGRSPYFNTHRYVAAMDMEMGACVEVGFRDV